MSLFASILGGAGAATNLIGTVGGLVHSRRNYELQKQNLDYQKGLQQQVFGREDTAYQRKADDMQKAGLSRTLAAGGGGQASGAIIPTKAPQRDTSHHKDMGQSALMAMTMLKQKQDISMSKAQQKLVQAQANKTNTEAAFMSENNPHLLKQSEVKSIIAQATRRDQIMMVRQKLRNQQYVATLNSYKIDGQVTKNLGLLIDNKLKELNVSQKEKDLILKSLAIELKKHDIEIYKRLQIPSHGSIYRDIGSAASGALKDMGAYNILGIGESQ